MPTDKQTVRQHALKLILGDGHRVGSRLAAQFSLSRQAANGHLLALTREGLIEAEGNTRARVYRLRTLRESEHLHAREGLDEDSVWREELSPVVVGYPKNVRFIWHYASTEMINNAVEHSDAAEVRVGVRANALFTEVRVADDGEGMFRKIQRALSLHDPREAILELAKGKLTTAPEHHTGEGIFFTSKLVDAFTIESGRLRFDHGARTAATLTTGDTNLTGTRVTMRLDNDSPRTVESVFDAFTDPEEFTFTTTRVPLRLAQYEGEPLVSRSQTKRVVRRFEKFKRVELDFEGVTEIGQGFADELFRVFARAQPQVRLIPVNTAPAVAKMVRRARSAAASEQ